MLYAGVTQQQEVNRVVGGGTSNTVAPVISGVAYDGQTLSSTTGTWSNPSGGYTYQWQADGVDITGKTSSTYVMERDYEGDPIRCVVTNNSVSANSNEIHQWIPSDSTATMEFWIDCSKTDSLTIVNSTQVSQADDLSGNSNHAVQGSSASMPGDNGTLNSKTAFSFYDDFMTLTNQISATDSTWVMIGNNKNNSGDHPFAYFGSDTDSDYVGRGVTGSSDTPSKINNVAHADADAKMLFDGESTELANIDRDDVFVYSEASSLMICTRDDMMAGDIEVGRGYGSSSADMHGYVGEALIYSTIMSAADITKMQGYAAHKWNFLGDLPGGHAHKTNPPTV